MDPTKHWNWMTKTMRMKTIPSQGLGYTDTCFHYFRVVYLCAYFSSWWPHHHYHHWELMHNSELWLGWHSSYSDYYCYYSINSTVVVVYILSSLLFHSRSIFTASVKTTEMTTQQEVPGYHLRTTADSRYLTVESDSLSFPFTATFINTYVKIRTSWIKKRRVEKNNEEVHDEENEVTFSSQTWRGSAPYNK